MIPEVALLLAMPLLGGITLALLGHRARAAELNVAFSTLSFLAAAALVARIVADGPVTDADEYFFVDSVNVVTGMEFMVLSLVVMMPLTLAFGGKGVI